MSSAGRRVNVGYDPENSMHVAISAVFNLIVNGVMAYFFYTYGWKNPDLAEHDDCWAGSADYGASFERDGFNTNVS